MSVLLALSIAMVVGLLSTRLMKILHLPNVTGYLIVGILIGPYCLKLVSAENLSDFSIITTLALGFIAFSIGGEFKIEHIKQIGGKVIVITFFQALSAVFLVMGVLFIVRAINPSLVSTPFILIVSAIAAATAPAATLMVVRQYKAKGPVTDTLLPVVAFDDAIALIAFSICVALAKVFASGEPVTFVSVALKPFLEILIALAIGAGLGIVLTLVVRFFKSRANRLGWMIACTVTGVGLCELLDLSSLLTCMMMGAFFANLRKDAIIILDGSERWTPPLFMLFFVFSGASLNLTVIPQIGIVGIIYILARSIGKYLGTRVGSCLMKSDKNVQKYLGIALLPQAGVAIGMAQMISGMPELAGISQQVTTVVLCATLIYELVGPVLTKIALTKAGEIDTSLAGPNVFKQLVQKAFKEKSNNS